MYENAQYQKDTNGAVVSIYCTINGIPSSVPINPANTDYQNLMRLVEAGELVIAPASP